MRNLWRGDIVRFCPRSAAYFGQIGMTFTVADTDHSGLVRLHGFGGWLDQTHLEQVSEEPTEAEEDAHSA